MVPNPLQKSNFLALQACLTHSLAAALVPKYFISCHGSEMLVLLHLRLQKMGFELQNSASFCTFQCRVGWQGNLSWCCDMPEPSSFCQPLATSLKMFLAFCPLLPLLLLLATWLLGCLCPFCFQFLWKRTASCGGVDVTSLWFPCCEGWGFC